MGAAWQHRLRLSQMTRSIMKIVTGTSVVTEYKNVINQGGSNMVAVMSFSHAGTCKPSTLEVEADRSLELSDQPAEPNLGLSGSVTDL